MTLELRGTIAAALLAFAAFAVAGVCAYLWTDARAELATCQDKRLGLERQLDAQRQAVDDDCDARLELIAKQHVLELATIRDEERIRNEADSTAERLSTDTDALLDTYRKLLGYDSP